jgi:glycosyltransferase 2 family protein
MRRGLRTGLYGVGALLAVLGVGFVVQRISAYSGEIDLSRLDAQTCWALVGLAAVYGSANLMLGVAWWLLLRHFGVTVQRDWALRTFGTSQLAKYVPGNVFHLASRQAIGMASGIGTWPLAKSLTWELGLLSLSGASFGMLALPLYAQGFSLTSAVCFFIGAVLGLTLVLRFAVGANCAYPFLWQVGFLGVMGALFAVLMELIAPEITRTLPWLCLVGAYVLAWLAGLVTPGAPAGIGVRESALLLLLQPAGDPSGLLAAVLLMRLVTVGGDLALFLLSSFSILNRKHDAA